MKVKIYDCETELELEEKINKFIDENEIEIIDIKYQISAFQQGEEQIYCFSSMIIYY